MLRTISTRSVLPATSPARRTLFGLSWLSGSKGKQPESAVEASKITDQPLTSSKTLSSSSEAASFPSKSTTSTPTTSTTSTTSPPTSTPSPIPKPSMIEKEEAAIRALLDRDGGSAGFEFEDGKPEGGQRRAVKREMFRLI